MFNYQSATYTSKDTSLNFAPTYDCAHKAADSVEGKWLGANTAAAALVAQVANVIGSRSFEIVHVPSTKTVYIRTGA